MVYSLLRFYGNQLVSRVPVTLGLPAPVLSELTGLRVLHLHQILGMALVAGRYRLPGWCSPAGLWPPHTVNLGSFTSFKLPAVANKTSYNWRFTGFIHQLITGGGPNRDMTTAKGWLHVMGTGDIGMFHEQ